MAELVKQVLRHSLVRYLAIGGATYGLLDLLINALVALGLGRGPAGTVAFLMTFGVAYTLQRVFTFRSEAENAGAMARYAILALFNSGVQGLFQVVAERMGYGIGLASLLATGVATVWNYFAYKHWVYVDRTHPLPADADTVAWHERAAYQVRRVVNVGSRKPVDIEERSR